MREFERDGRRPAVRYEPDFDDLFNPEPRTRKKRPSNGKMRFPKVSGHLIADILAGAVAVAAILLVFVNALGLQRAPRPGLVPTHTSSEATKRATPSNTTVPMPQARPDPGNRRTRSDLIQNIQRELSSRGHYDGAVDGQSGPRVSQAIREFEQMRGLRVTGEPSDVLLEKIRKAEAKSDITGSIGPSPRTTTNSRLIDVQRMLARYGYGPVRINGEMDRDTRSAIERFESDRNLPATGEVSDQLVRELAAFSGNSLR